MELSADIVRAVDLCLERNVPFAAYVPAGGDRAFFFADPYPSRPARERSPRLSVNLWNSPAAIDIFGELDAAATLERLGGIPALPPAGSRPWERSTTFAEYSLMVEEVVSRLRRRGGKTVISRTACGKTPPRKTSDIAREYFAACPGTFRYLYFTRQTGCWIGASPEIIVDSDRGSDRFVTMSLAGTRAAADAGTPWDGKNLEEHEYVTRFIEESLHALGLPCRVGPRENLRLGKIEHLCNRISSSLRGRSLQSVLEALSPTPALAGYPVAQALGEIALLERHERRCYGGYVALEDADGFRAYVNLRCAQFDSGRFCVYSGGGLTADSTAAEEWEEARAKVETVLEILSGK